MFEFVDFPLDEYNRLPCEILGEILNGHGKGFQKTISFSEGQYARSTKYNWFPAGIKHEYNETERKIGLFHKAFDRGVLTVTVTDAYARNLYQQYLSGAERFKKKVLTNRIDFVNKMADAILSPYRYDISKGSDGAWTNVRTGSGNRFGYPTKERSGWNGRWLANARTPRPDTEWSE